MKPNMTAIERAFELARSGHVASVADIRAQLKREGYEQSLVVGRVLTSQLRCIIDSMHNLKQPTAGVV
jgi:hypothetical protein